MASRLQDDTPEGLRPYIFHGLDLNPRGAEAIGACPWCDRDNKFYVNMESGLWDCKVCGEQGNVHTFIRSIHKHSIHMSTAQLESLAADRGMLSSEPLIEWGVVPSMITGEWLVPAYDAKGDILNLYRYVNTSKGARLYATPGVNHGMFGVPLHDPSKPKVYVTEGCWDGMALWESLRTAKEAPPNGQSNGSSNGTGIPHLTVTGNPDASLYRDANVLSTPGCAVWLPSWNDLLSGKIVYLCFDNDHPRVNQKTGKRVPPASWAGMKRLVAEHLLKADQPPKALYILRWGEGDHNPDLPSGCDLRDLLTGKVEV